MAEDIDNIWQFWKFGKSGNANDIIRKVDKNVIELVNLILKEEPTTLVQVGRKAAHLIREYKQQLEPRFLISLIVFYNFSDFSQSRPKIPSGKPVILIEDSIHHGRQLAQVLLSLKEDKIEVSKVFCYLKNQKGVRTLVKNGLITEKQVVSLFTSNSEVEYQEKAKELHAYFRSHIEPTDQEICYNLYNVNTQLDSEQLIKIIEPSLLKLFCADSMGELDEKGFTSNIKEVSYITANNEVLQKWADALIKKENDYQVLGLNLRFKVNQRLIDSDFTMIVKIEADCSVNKEINNEKCLSSENQCLMNCSSHENVDAEKLKEAVCPQCLDLALSHYLLGKLNIEITRAFKEVNLGLILKEKHRPVNLTET
jgi:hypothetical protein